MHLDSYISIGSGGLLLNQQQWQQQVEDYKGKTRRLRGHRNQRELGKWTDSCGGDHRENLHRMGGHGNAEIEADREDPYALPFLMVNLKSLAKKKGVF